MQGSEGSLGAGRDTGDTVSYSYRAEREKLFTEAGTRIMLEMRDKIRGFLETSGAFMSGNACVAGDVWTMLAVLDYLVERGEIREVTDPAKVAGQHRVFVSAV